jgi:Uma2 family endonuclease
VSTAIELKTDKKVWTDEEFMALPKDGHRYEIVNGELIDMGSAGALRGYVCSLLLAALASYVMSNKLGVILDSSTAFKMKNGNRRSPDLSFFAALLHERGVASGRGMVNFSYHTKTCHETSIPHPQLV